MGGTGGCSSFVGPAERAVAARIVGVEGEACMSEPEIETQTHEDATPSEAPAGSAGTLSRDAVYDALKNVFDPELGLNIVDLGLVYEVDVTPEGDVDIQYTLTTMGCPIGPLIEDQMRALLTELGVREVRPEMVIRPPWTPEMMSDEAKASLGIF
jgi:metal-sulfur cluster biosynthetic enzyme